MSIYFILVFCIFINAIILITYFSKKKISSFENNIYTSIVSLNIIAIVFEIVCNLCANNILPNELRNIAVRLFMAVLFLWGSMLTLYTFIILKKPKKTRFFLYLILAAWLLISIPLWKCEIEFLDTNGKYYVGGVIVIYSIIISTIYIFTNIIMIIIHRKNLSKQIYPVISYIILSSLVVIMNRVDPTLPIINCIENFVGLFMYFTIENPDVKMLEEFRIAKDRAEKANEEKELFLYNITQDIRNPLSEIKKASIWLDENSKNQNVKDASYYISKNANNVLDIVNDVLDISGLEITNIKVYDTKYDINNLVKYLEKTYKSQVKDKIDFRFNVDTNIPSTLYGDQLRLKQVLQILIENSIKYTKEGFIEFKLNTIVKKGICRLIINIEDSGEGIKPSEMKSILNKDERIISNEKIDDNKKNLAMAKSITSLLGGILLIDSELGKGTKMTLVLDQKIYDEKSLELNKIETDVNKYISNTKVLFVTEDIDYKEKALKKLARYDIDITVLDLGSKCLDKVRANKKYNLIIIDEQLKHLSVLEIMEKLKEIPNFDMPVAVLTNNTENRGYIIDGFKYVLDRKLIYKELDKVIEEIEQ